MSVNSEKFPKLVAHRGYSSRYPENTLPAMEQALISGACYLECDIQFSKDGVPLLLHDVNLSRLTGKSKEVFSMDFRELAELRASYPEKFDRQYNDISISCLSEFVKLMLNWPNRYVFVEIKSASAKKFGYEFVLDKIIEEIEKIRQQVIIISFDINVLKIVRDMTDYRIGWVIEDWNPENLNYANELKPDYMFVDYECLPDDLESLPDASWSWALYEIDDPQKVADWLEKGASLIETNDIGGMMQLEKFRCHGCHG